MNQINRKLTESDTDTEFVVVSDNHPNLIRTMPETEEDMEIDLIDLAYTLLDKIHYIILCFLIGAVLFNAYAYFCISPTYTSTAKMYVVSASSDSVVNLSDLNIGTSLTADYEQLMLSYPVLEQVIDELDLDMSSEALARMIRLENPSDTRLLNITATSTDPVQARDIANKLMEVSIEYLPRTMSTNPPNVAQSAKIASHKAGPSYTKYTMLGAFAGALLYCAYLVFIYIMDDTVHTPEDMERYFGVVPLTAIPDGEVGRDEDDVRKKRKKSFWQKAGYKLSKKAGNKPAKKRGNKSLKKAGNK